MDRDLSYEIRNQDVLSLVGWSPYAGRVLYGKPMRTILRGRTIYLDGMVTAQRGLASQALARQDTSAAAAA